MQSTDEMVEETKHKNTLCNTACFNTKQEETTGYQLDAQAIHHARNISSNLYSLAIPHAGTKKQSVHSLIHIMQYGAAIRHDLTVTRTRTFFAHKLDCKNCKQHFFAHKLDCMHAEITHNSCLDKKNINTQQMLRLLRI
jgi:hypothetical protein